MDKREYLLFIPNFISKSHTLLERKFNGPKWNIDKLIIVTKKYRFTLVNCYYIYSIYTMSIILCAIYTFFYWYPHLKHVLGYVYGPYTLKVRLIYWIRIMARIVIFITRNKMCYNIITKHIH